MTIGRAPATILIVEDNPANLALAEEVLKAEGHSTISASSAEEAQTLIVRQLPDLILLDLRLPGIDGLTFVRKLRSSPLATHIPVIALTAQAMPEDRAQAMEAHVEGYITKPFDRDELLLAVKKALDAEQA